ncbi:hypothetical protein F1880_009687 [Penicillium rolfsii]|nr:hypothetical protein F1880_009687 [Penicillium rolfsii]
MHYSSDLCSVMNPRPPIKPTKRKHVCQICNKAFKRSEHCTRHQRGRQFPCIVIALSTIPRSDSDASGANKRESPEIIVIPDDPMEEPPSTCKPLSAADPTFAIGEYTMLHAGALAGSLPEPGPLRKSSEGVCPPKCQAACSDGPPMLPSKRLFDGDSLASGQSLQTEPIRDEACFEEIQWPLEQMFDPLWDPVRTKHDAICSHVKDLRRHSITPKEHWPSTPPSPRELPGNQRFTKDAKQQSQQKTIHQFARKPSYRTTQPLDETASPGLGCNEPGPSTRNAAAPRFPSETMMQVYLKTFFSRVHDTFPLFDEATFNPSETDNVVLRALCAIGAILCHDLPASSCLYQQAELLHLSVSSTFNSAYASEFLTHPTTPVDLADPLMSTQTPICMIQARLLLVYFEVFSGSPAYRRRGTPSSITGADDSIGKDYHQMKQQLAADPWIPGRLSGNRASIENKIKRPFQLPDTHFPPGDSAASIGGMECRSIFSPILSSMHSVLAGVQWIKSSLQGLQCVTELANADPFTSAHHHVARAATYASQQISQEAARLLIDSEDSHHRPLLAATLAIRRCIHLQLWTSPAPIGRMALLVQPEETLADSLREMRAPCTDMPTLALKEVESILQGTVQRLLFSSEGTVDNNSTIHEIMATWDALLLLHQWTSSLAARHATTYVTSKAREKSKFLQDLQILFELSEPEKLYTESSLPNAILDLVIVFCARNRAWGIHTEMVY